MWTVYGIKNCDSVQKALSWLKSRQMDHRLHDYRVDGVNADLIQRFIDELGVDAVLNRRSTSWRQLAEAQKQDMNAEKAIQLMLATPTLIKRPILDNGMQLMAGFGADLPQNPS